jgi:hypothetical protein
MVSIYGIMWWEDNEETNWLQSFACIGGLNYNLNPEHVVSRIFLFSTKIIIAELQLLNVYLHFCLCNVVIHKRI